jgi:hypothetical protein
LTGTWMPPAPWPSWARRLAGRPLPPQPHQLRHDAFWQPTEGRHDDRGRNRPPWALHNDAAQNTLLELTWKVIVTPGPSGTRASR